MFGDVLETRGPPRTRSRSPPSPAMKREFFQASSKYSDMVGVMTTSAVRASLGVALPLARRRVELLGVPLKARAAAT